MVGGNHLRQAFRGMVKTVEMLVNLVTRCSNFDRNNFGEWKIQPFDFELVQWRCQFQEFFYLIRTFLDGEILRNGLKRS